MTTVSEVQALSSGELFIGGRWEPGGATMPVLNPATGREIAKAAVGDARRRGPRRAGRPDSLR